jgi:hypothetical protein
MPKREPYITMVYLYEILKIYALKSSLNLVIEENKCYGMKIILKKLLL